MNTSSHREKLISGFGGAVSILVVFWLTQFAVQALHVQLLLVASMGASAVLLFATPKSPLAQPWNVIGGHVVAAIIGVFMHKFIANPVLGAALAVGLAITAMYYLQCLHPPGGATSLIPLIGGSAIDEYGILFVLFPVGFGACLMVLVAIVFNYAFKWRRYPLALNPPAETGKSGASPYPDITHADFVLALSEIDTYVDISEQDLLRIYAIASRGPHKNIPESSGD